MQDLRLARGGRSRATPVVTAVAVLSLALGIGANTAIFSLVDSLILRTLPVAEPQRLVILAGRRRRRRAPGLQLRHVRPDPPARRRVRRRAAYSNCCGQGTLTVGGEPGPVDRFFVSGDFFETLGVSPAVGRLFTPRRRSSPAAARTGRGHQLRAVAASGSAAPRARSARR